MQLLLVSSDQKIINSCTEAFSSLATLRMSAVQDAGAALAVLNDHEHSISHVLVDLRLPNSSGLIVCNAFGKSPRLSGAKLWTIDAGTSADLFRTAYQLGAERNLLRDDVPSQVVGRSFGSGKAKDNVQSASSSMEADEETALDSQRMCVTDKIRIGGVHNCLSREKFDEHFSAMSKSERFRTRIVAIEISNSEAIFPKVTPDVFHEMLSFIAQRISDHFRHFETKLTYNGRGVFICAFSGQFHFEPSRLSDTLQGSSAEAHVSLRFILDKLTINVGPVKRVSGVFKSNYHQHSATLSNFPQGEVAKSTSPPVAPRRPRIQTRLLRAHEKLVLPRQPNGS